MVCWALDAIRGKGMYKLQRSTAPEATSKTVNRACHNYEDLADDFTQRVYMDAADATGKLVLVAKEFSDELQ